MKTIATFLSLLILLSLNMMLLGQETQKKMHIKVQKEVNGVSTHIDTVITAGTHEELAKMLKDLGLDTHIEMPDGNATWFEEKDGEHTKEMKVKVIRIDGEKGELPDLEGLDPETRALIEKHMQEGKEGKKMIFIEKNGDSTHLDGTGHMEWQEEGDAQVFKFSTEGDEFGEKKIMMVQSDGKTIEIKEMDGEVQVIDLERSEGDPMVIIRKMEGGEKGQMNITVEVSDEQARDGQVVMEKTVKVAIFLRDVEEADKEVLKRSGVEVNDLENSLSIEQLSFYPNPSNGLFNLSFESQEEGDVDITVVNAEGRKVYEEQLPAFSGRYEKQIDLSGNPSGVYFLNLYQNGKVLNKKLVLN